MPTLTQKFIFRSDLRANPTVRYLFGDNLLRIGMGGQAKEIRGEPNAIGVATKRAPGMHPDDFFSDKDHDDLIRQIDLDLSPAFDHVRAGGLVVIPADGLGTGLSQLPERAPKVNDYLLHRLASLRITRNLLDGRK